MARDHQSEVEIFTTEELFKSAVSIVRNLPKDGPFQPSNEMKLKFYAFYKQATQGPNDTKKPIFYRIIECHKWEAWKKLGDMSKEEAMNCYIQELKQVMESIPDDNGNHFSADNFEDILGRKFYLYWRKRYDEKKTSNNKQQPIESDAISLLSNDEFSTTSQRSEESYKTPKSSDFDTKTHSSFILESDGFSDQIASAIIRLQNGIEITNKRLDSCELQLKQTQTRLQRLEFIAFVMALVFLAAQSKKLIN